MRIVRINQPQVQAILLSNVKSYLNINYDDSDEILKLLINQATGLIENHTNFILRSATYSQFYDYNELNNILKLWKQPVSTVEFIKTYSIDNEESTVDTSFYYVEPQGNRLYFKTLPSENYRPIDSMEIRYTVSPDTKNIPADLLLAIYDLVAYYFDNRGNPDKNIPQSIINIINSHKDRFAVVAPNMEVKLQ